MPPILVPSGRLLALLGLAAPLFLLGDAVALAADALILTAAAADAALAPGRRRLVLTRRAPRWLALGSVAEIEIEATNATGRAVRLRATDDLPPGLAREGPDILEWRVAPGRRAAVTYRVRAAERGAMTLGPVHVRAAGPLGLVWRQCRFPLADEVNVLPGILDVRRHRLLGLQRQLALAGVRTVRRRSERGEFESLREYVRGDDPRTIDWKATARRGAPMVRRYQAERSQNVLLAIDAGRLMTERIAGRERLDHALAAALLLADVAAAYGDRVGFLVFGGRVEQYRAPSRLPISRLAEAFGRVRARLVESNYPAAFAYLARRLRRRSLVVLFSDVIDARASAALIAHVSRAAARHLPLVVALRNPELDAAAVAGAHAEAGVFHRIAAEELLQARAAALAGMRRAGALVADALPDEAIHVVVNRYLEVKREGLL
ncbi:MAG TPA: DUF58 domain-containing protein [Longimicrobiales bacterium]